MTKTRTCTKSHSDAHHVQGRQRAGAATEIRRDLLCNPDCGICTETWRVHYSPYPSSSFFPPSFTRSTFPSSTRCIVLLSEDAPPGASSKLLIPKRRGSDQCLSCCLPLSHVTLIVTAAANFVSHFVGARCLSSFLPAIPFFSFCFCFFLAAILT